MKKDSNSQAAPPSALWYRRVAGTALTAGVGVLGTPSDAPAQIVVWTPNPPVGTMGTAGTSNLYFDFVSGTALPTNFANAQFQLRRSSLGSIGQAAFFYAVNANNHVIGNTGSGFFYPKRMAANEPIGGPGPWLVAAGINAQTLGFQHYPGYGNWPSPSTGFLGLRFGDGTDFNYGWAQISLDSNSNITLSQFAYNTVQNQEILAGQTSSVPEPSSAALLVLGAAGLSAYRKRRNAKAESQPESTTTT